MSLVEKIEDAEADAAFDGSSTEAERLHFRCGDQIHSLQQRILYGGTADEMLPFARRLATLLERLREAESDASDCLAG